MDVMIPVVYRHSTIEVYTYDYSSTISHHKGENLLDWWLQICSLFYFKQEFYQLTCGVFSNLDNGCNIIDMRSKRDRFVVFLSKLH